jgi:hypothetical protein
MSVVKKDKETERFYNISYFIIPIPMIAGAIFAVYVMFTEDSRTTSFCTVANQTSVYQKSPLQRNDFSSFEEMTLDICKDKDYTLDDGDGRTNGKVRWFTCKGTICGPGWEKFLAEK